MGRLIALNDIIRSKQYSCCMLHAGGSVMGNTEKDAFMSCSTILFDASWCFTDEAHVVNRWWTRIDIIVRKIIVKW